MCRLNYYSDIDKNAINLYINRRMLILMKMRMKRITKMRMFLRKVNIRMQAVVKMYANNHGHR